jgi:hypothetical protein
MRNGKSSSERLEAGNPRQIIEQKIAAGIVDGSLVELGREYWQTTLANGVPMPNGERAIVTDSDLHHLLNDPRILRVPERIRSILVGVFEIRTAQYGRRRGLSWWDEHGVAQYGYVILEGDGRVRTMHLTTQRKLEKMANQGERLWVRDR